MKHDKHCEANSEACGCELRADLLEALEMCLHAVGLAGWEDDLCAQKARAAIAKAKGES